MELKTSFHNAYNYIPRGTLISQPTTPGWAMANVTVTECLYKPTSKLAAERRSQGKQGPTFAICVCFYITVSALSTDFDTFSDLILVYCFLRAVPCAEYRCCLLQFMVGKQLAFQKSSVVRSGSATCCGWAVRCFAAPFEVTHWRVHWLSQLAGCHCCCRASQEQPPRLCAGLRGCCHGVLLCMFRYEACYLLFSRLWLPMTDWIM